MNTIKETLAHLVDFPSVTPVDEGCQEFMMDYLKDLGFTCLPFNQNPVSNFFAYYGETGPLLVFAGHTDVISNIVFNSKIQKMISTGLDNQIIVWDLEKGCEIYKLIILENDNWVVQLPNSPYYMSSKNAINLLNCVNNKIGDCDIKAYDLKYNRPNIVLRTISDFFQK